MTQSVGQDLSVDHVAVGLEAFLSAVRGDHQNGRLDQVRQPLAPFLQSLGVGEETLADHHARNAREVFPQHVAKGVLVLAQVGLQPAFDVSAGTRANDDGDAIPLAERFFAGGGNTQRGLPENQAGPRDPLTGFPLGGSALFFNNTELRFPLYGANINGVLFEDAGNVYSSLGAISFRVDQRNAQDFDYMVQDVGFGLRYRTPIGPVRLDLSFSPNAPRFYGLKGSEEDLINGTAISTVQKISAFQFHFSLGQAF